jgi:radical SAM protein with 4Fe4S-binding SPASM domain
VIFERIHIEITNSCNLQCSFCPEVERDKFELTPKDFQHLVEKSKPYAERVCLHLMGEPLTHTHFDQMLKVCDEADIAVQLTTNGMLTHKWEKELLQSTSLKQINFSLQSFKDNFPEASGKVYLKKVLEFAKKIEQERPDIYINYRLWNLGDMSAYENDFLLKDIEEFYHINFQEFKDVREKKSHLIKQKTYLHLDTRFDWPSLKFPHQNNIGFCYGLKNHLGILVDGTVVPCCLDKEGYIRLGNLFSTDLPTILQTEKARNLRVGFERGERKEELCQKCSFINRFQKKAEKRYESAHK